MKCPQNHVTRVSPPLWYCENTKMFPLPPQPLCSPDESPCCPTSPRPLPPSPGPPPRSLPPARCPPAPSRTVWKLASRPAPCGHRSAGGVACRATAMTFSSCTRTRTTCSGWWPSVASSRVSPP